MHVRARNNRLDEGRLGPERERRNCEFRAFILEEDIGYIVTQTALNGHLVPASNVSFWCLRSWCTSNLDIILYHTNFAVVFCGRQVGVNQALYDFLSCSARIVREQWRVITQPPATYLTSARRTISQVSSWATKRARGRQTNGAFPELEKIRKEGTAENNDELPRHSRAGMTKQTQSSMPGQPWRLSSYRYKKGGITKIE